MLPLLREAAARRFVSPGEQWIALTEYEADTRIADLVLARLDSDRLKRRLHTAPRLFSRSELLALTVVRRDRHASLEWISQAMHMTSKTARPILDNLTAGGFVDRNSGAFRSTLRLEPLFSRIIVFEAKKAEWRRALVQARSHSPFAHELYVAYDEYFARRFESHKRTFASEGVALIGLSQSSEPRWVLKARRRRPDSFALLVASERLLSRVLGRVATPLPQTRLPNAVVPSDHQEVRWLPEPPPITSSLF